MTTAAPTIEEELGLEEPAEKPPRYEFDADFQQKICALLIRDTPFAQLTDGLVRPEFFENTGFASLVKVTNGYFERYKKAPGDRTTLANLIKNAVRDRVLPLEYAKLAASVVPAVYETDVSDREFVADECATFARHQATAKAILDSVDLIERRDFDAIASIMRKALDTGINQTGGSYDYAKEVKNRSQERRDRAAGIRPPTGITTGFAALDNYLYHKGWGRRELSVLMGAAKAGKSMSLISFAIAAIGNGYRCLYVTLEVSKDIIAMRSDAHVADIAMSELDLHINDVEEKVTAFNEKAAPFIIEEFPTGTMRVSDLRRLVEHYKAQGIVFDAVFLDYADLMAPERVTDSVTENSKSVYVGLRGLCMQEGFALVTATQTNREGAKKAVATMTDIAEDFNKIRIADLVISINRTAEEAAMNQARLFFAACRNNRSGFTLRIEQAIDRARFITKLIGED